ncbi:MAG: hypothetical protein Q7W45_10680 [Bacteroidota bacterium]|nr:hypothetical protein [Bacteroidota bacterium]MDP3146079.1 hypothetical protein [Bacteroidota bacterium]MDP3558615.1 hypothetical protein [Bacteroidota bacterium]
MAEKEDKQTETIIKLLTEKSVMKQDVYSNTIIVFNLFKDLLSDKADELSKGISKVDQRVQITYKNINLQSMQLKVAGDMLDFTMHSNVFEFDPSHPMFKTSYVKNNVYNSFVGIINVYNFLADSYKYNRLNDLGYLIARIFINREKRFFVETRTQIAYKYSSFSEKEISQEDITDIINELVFYAISFDLFTPPFDAVRQVSIYEMQEKANSGALRTGKRLGYAGTEGSNSRFDDETNL